VDAVGNILGTFSMPPSLRALQPYGMRYWKEVKDTTLFDLNLQSG